MELQQKLSHWAYSASMLNYAKRTRQVSSILFHILADYAQFHCRYSAMIFTLKINCDLCVLGKYAKFCCPYLPSMLKVILRTHWVRQTAIKLQKTLTTFKRHQLKIFSRPKWKIFQILNSQTRWVGRKITISCYCPFNTTLWPNQLTFQTYA